MASFDEKVEALRRLQERRQARMATETASRVAPSPDAGVSSQRPIAKDVDGKELTDVLERYARLDGLPISSPTCNGYPAIAPGIVGAHCDDASAPLESHGIVEAHCNDSSAPLAPHGQDTGDEADALYCLGHCCEQGLHDCEQDIARAAVYYRMAAEKGSVVGQWRLGHLHEFGQGVEFSDEGAAHWYRLAAKAGHAHAQSSLALLLQDGRAVACEDDEAFRWHLAAASQDQALSQYCAARCLAEGEGVAQDEAAARKLMEKSAAAGFPLAVEALAQGTLGHRMEFSRAHEDGCEDDTCEARGGGSLLDIAARVAKQIGHLSDAEADTFLEELMDGLGSWGDAIALDAQDSLELNSDLGPASDSAAWTSLGLHCGGVAAA